MKLAHREGKPVFLSEFGTMAYGWVPDKPGPSCPQSALAGSELVIRLANAGVDGFNRWSFLNRGDLDGQWQFVDTWDPRQKKLLGGLPAPSEQLLLPGPAQPFYGEELGGPCQPRRGRQACRVAASVLRGACAARGETSRWRSSTTLPRSSTSSSPCRAWPKPTRLYRYRYGEAERDRADVKVNPQTEFSLGPAANELHDTLPPNSLTIYSTYKLEHDAPGRDYRIRSVLNGGRACPAN